MDYAKLTQQLEALSIDDLLQYAETNLAKMNDEAFGFLNGMLMAIRLC